MKYLPSGSFVDASDILMDAIRCCISKTKHKHLQLRTLMKPKLISEWESAKGYE